MAKRKSSVISVLIEGNNRGLTEALDDSSSKLATFGKAAGAALAGVGLAFGAFAKSGLDAAIATEAAQERLATLLRNTGLASEEQIAALNAQAAALEGVGVAAASNITTLQAQLATFDLSADAIKTLTPAITDYVIAEKGATATADDFQAAANGLAQALQGNFGALSRVGFVLDDTTKELIANGTEAERAAALVDVLSSTYDGFNVKARETTAGGLQALRNQFGAIQEAVGVALLPVLRRFIDWFDRNAPTIQAFAERVIGGLIQAIGWLGDKFAEWRPKVEAAVDFIRGKLDEFRGFFDENLAGPIEDIRDRIGTFADAVRERLGGLVDELGPRMQEFKAFFADLDLADPGELGRRIGEALGGALRSALESLLGMSGEVGEAFGEVLARVDWFRLGMDGFTYLAQLFAGLAVGFFGTDWYVPLLQSLGQNWPQVLLSIVSIMFLPAKWAGAIGKALARIPFVGRMLQWLFTGLNSIGAGLRARVALLWETFSSAFMTALRGGGPTITRMFVDFLMFLPRTIVRVFDDLIINLALAFQRFGAAFGGGIRNLIATAAEWLGRLMTPFTNFGRTLVDDLFTLGRNIIDALIRGIRSMAGALADVVRNIGRSIWDGLSRLWRISSPSKVFMDIGENAMLGLALGMENSSRLVADAVRGVGLSVTAVPEIGPRPGGVGGPVNITINVDGGDPQQVVEAIRRYTRANGPLGQVVTL